MTRRFGRSARTLARNAAQLGQPLGRSEAGDRFFAELARVRAALTVAGLEAERDVLLEQLACLYDHFERTAY